MHNAEDLSITSDTKQKIFPIEAPSGIFAYTVSGLAELSVSDGERRIEASLAKAASAAAESLRGRKTSNLIGYAVRFSNPIHKVLSGF
jgi:hypothetical protein